MDVAALQFEAFVRAFPDDPRVTYAGNLWIDALNRHGHPLDAMDRAAQVMLANPHFEGQDRTNLKRIVSMIATERLRAIAGIDPRAAAKLTDAAADAATGRDRLELLFDAGSLYESAGDLRIAAQRFRASAKVFSDAEHIARTLKRAADLEQQASEQDARANVRR